MAEASGTLRDPGSPRWAAAAGVVVLVAVAASLAAAGRPVTSDEAREAAIARNMLASGDWRRTVLGGNVVHEKPPFFYMAVAAAARAAGRFSPLSARVPSVFFAGLALAATAVSGTALFSRRAGAAAAVILATTYLFVVNAHACLVDAPLVGFTALGIAAFSVRSRHDAPRWDALWGLAAGAALLAKGLVGPVLLVLFTLPLWFFSARRRPLRRSISAGALAVPALALGLWIAVTWSGGGARALAESLWINQAGRFLGFERGEYVHHREGFFYYLVRLPGLLFPWILLPAAASRRAFSQSSRGSALRPLACGFFLALLLLSASSTKRGLYLLPLTPVAALLSAGCLEERLRERTPRHGPLLIAQLGLAAAGAAALAVAGLSMSRGDPEAELFRHIEERVNPRLPFLAYNLNENLLGKAELEMRRPPVQQYSVERSVEAVEAGAAYVLSQDEHMREPHVAPLRRALVPVYVGEADGKVVVLYRARSGG